MIAGAWRRGLTATLLLVSLTGCASASPSPSPSPIEAGQASSPVGPSATPSATPAPTPTPTPTPQPTPTPEPTPVMVPAPFTGLPIELDKARRNPVALMVDDHPDARPQSGLSTADIVWHAPAEGGIPRYMAIYQSRMGNDVGPIRSARVYYVLWAAEINALYGHSGGSPQALAMLRKYGQGEYVFDANEFRYGGGAFGRIDSRPAPHNVYTDVARMRRLGIRLGAEDHDIETPFRFGPDAPLAERPTGGKIKVPYPHNTVSYAYDRESNTYVRDVSGEKGNVDAATDRQVAPKNVVIMHVKFIQTGDSKSRLEGDIVGKGKAEIATNGRITRGTWEKDDDTAPTRFFDANGDPMVFTAGQTFIQVVPTDLDVTMTEGTPAG
jgi:hypothetical protein